MIDIILGISLNIATAGDVLDYEEDYGVHVKVQHETFPVYGWASYQQGEFFILGQGVADTQAPSVGLGVTRDITPRLSVFAETGMAFNKLSNDKPIVQETAYTYLVGRHEVENRPVPVTVNYPYDQESYDTTYAVDNAFVAKLGLNFQISDSWSTSVAYRYSVANTLIEIFDFGAKEAGLGWWMEEATTDTSAVEVQFLYRF